MTIDGGSGTLDVGANEVALDATDSLFQLLIGDLVGSVASTLSFLISW